MHYANSLNAATGLTPSGDSSPHTRLLPRHQTGAVAILSIVTQTESPGVMHANSASNVWTDSEGFLHLRIARRQNQWTCAEVTLSRSLGYGEYKFILRQLPPMTPATVRGLFTHDPMEAGQNHHEMDIEPSQWGDPAGMNSGSLAIPRLRHISRSACGSGGTRSAMRILRRSCRSTVFGSPMAG
jgi:hypothetical protein